MEYFDLWLCRQANADPSKRQETSNGIACTKLLCVGRHWGGYPVRQVSDHSHKKDMVFFNFLTFCYRNLVDLHYFLCCWSGSFWYRLSFVCCYPCTWLREWGNSESVWNCCIFGIKYEVDLFIEVPLVVCFIVFIMITLLFYLNKMTNQFRQF